VVGGTFTIDGGAGTDTISWDDASDVTGRTVNVNQSGATVSIPATGASLVYSNAEVINVASGSGADIFNVRALALPTVVNLDANAPTITPGDVLNYDAQGFAATDNGSSIASAGRQTINYVDFETATLLNPPPACTSTVSGSNAVMTCGATNDTVIFDQSGGLLRHNRFTAGDFGFNSDFDWDSTLPGDQTLAAAVASTVTLDTDGGNDTTTIGSASAPASVVGGVFTIDTGAGTDTINWDDAADVIARIVNVNATTAGVSIPSTGAQLAYANAEVVNVAGGSSADTFNVRALAISAAINIDGNAPTLAPGDVLNYDAEGRTATDNGTSITSPGVQTINYVEIETVNVLNAAAPPVPVPAASPLALAALALMLALCAGVALKS
jgi:hypothetical protein